MRALAFSIALGSVALLLGGCARSDSLAGQRTVFSNPLAAPTIDRTGIGPQCDVQFGRDATCLGDVVATSRRGRVAILRNGETIRLTRNQARILRERAVLADAQRQLPPPPPPLSPAPLEPVLPVADDAAETP